MRQTILVLGPAIVLGLFVAACGDDSAPFLAPLEPQSVTVNQTLVLPLVVSNPDGIVVSYSFVGPPLPNLDLTSTLTGSPAGAEFRWTPLSSHVGSHQFDFTLTSSLGVSTQSVLITVQPQLGSAPIFIQPGKGGTYDLDKVQCIKFDLEVKDDDSASVAIREGASLPAGAELTTEGDKRARFEWCPTDTQVNESLSWILQFKADDGEHEPTPHRFQAVLRKAAKAGCPGAPPTINIISPPAGGSLSSSAGFPIVAEVTDDTGIRDAPVLYFSMTEPATPPDLGAMVVSSFEEADGENRWEAQVPPLTGPDADGVTIWFLVSAVDNDDEAGTTCDHRTDTAVQSFIATKDGGKAENCELCGASSGCASGVCSAAGKCLPPCEGCPSVCDEVTTIDGQSEESCGGNDACQSVVPPDPGDCIQDNLFNNTLEDGLSLLGGALGGQICSGEESDYFSFASGLDMNVEFTLQDLDKVDLDLQLLDESGNVLSFASTTKEIETASFCVTAGSTTYARVYGYEFAAIKQGAYQISGEGIPGSCCENDAHEPNNSIDAAGFPVLTSFSGTLCPYDKDHFAFDVVEKTHAEIGVTYEGNVAAVDISIHGPLPSQIQVGSGLGINGKAQFNGYFTEPGQYVVAVVPYGSKQATYNGTISFESQSGCTFTFDCPENTVCNADSECIGNSCAPPIQGCPLGHTCAKLTPLSNICSFDCAINGECRENLGEACKWLSTGRSCGKAGNQQIGKSCTDFNDCASQMTCNGDWPGGYCTHLKCQSDFDCPGGSKCANVDGVDLCLEQCGVPFVAQCRLSEGYACGFTLGKDGNFFNGCQFGSISI